MKMLLIRFIPSILLPSLAYADGMGGNGHMGGGWFPMMGGVFWGFILLIIFAVFIGVIIFAATKLTRASLSGKPDETREDSPAEILKTRYAKGEITGEEYQKMRKALEG